MQVGLLVAADARGDGADVVDVEEARRRLLATLTDQFPQFHWAATVLHRRRFSPLGAIDPLTLLEFAVQEKIARKWDYALVLVPNELQLRDRTPTWGVPSSALEVAVISTGEPGPTDDRAATLVAMSLHLLGHMWGLDHAESGPMRASALPAELDTAPFPEEQRIAIVDRLEDVADTRIEETASRIGRLAFYWRTFMADPSAILTDIWGYAPWKLPFRLGRLTAGAATFIVILLLTSESWEVGVNFSPATLAAGTVTAVLAAALFLFVGQNLGKMSGPGQWHEQLVRTRIVIFSSLLVGMASLWIVLTCTAFVVSLAMPEVVLARWLTSVPGPAVLARYAAFMATLGLIGGAFGGNLEDEGNFKAKFLLDDDT